MKIETTVDSILELFDRPAFCVSGDVIQGANQMAVNRGILVGEPVEAYLRQNLDEYRAYTAGLLYLSLTVGSTGLDACVSCLGQAHLFTLENENPELRAYALAARELRLPLSQVMGVSDRLFPTLGESEDSRVARELATMNRGLYQMLRLVNNMSDAASCGISRMEIRDVTSVFGEIMERAAELCREAGFVLRYSGYPQAIYTLADSQKLERAVYNLLSNAISVSSPGDVIDVSLALHGNAVCLTVTDQGTGKDITPSMFHHYLREPGLSDGQSGLGLGFSLIRAAAASHGGTFLVRRNPEGGITATLRFPVCQRAEQFRFPPLRLDYAGERDHGLLELSQYLPDHLYDPKKL